MKELRKNKIEDAAVKYSCNHAYDYKKFQDFQGDVMGVIKVLNEAFKAGIKWEKRNKKCSKKLRK